MLPGMEAINASIKNYIKPEHKLLLLNVLYFLSIKTGNVHFITDSDFESFNALVNYCHELAIDLEKYVTCFFMYYNKYITSTHKIHLSYLLNAKVVSFCSNNLQNALIDYSLLQTVKNDILYTEKSLRQYATDHNISYDKSFLIAYTGDSLSEVFLLYKHYMNYELIAGSALSKNNEILLACLHPFFTYITSRNGVFSDRLLHKWNNSKVEDFKFCPIFFRDRYLTREIDYQNLMYNEASITGSCVHNAFEELINKYNKSKNKNLQKSYERFLTSKTFLYLQETYPEHVPGFKEFFTITLPKLITSDTILLTEHEMNMQYKSYSLYGTADLILINGSTATLLDYKTSKIDNEFWLKKNNDKYANQLSLYVKFIENTVPNVNKVETAYIIYTRGLIHELPILHDNILDTVIDKILSIKQHIKLKSFTANTKSCLLCRHPFCEHRATPSMWDENGERIVKKSN